MYSDSSLDLSRTGSMRYESFPRYKEGIESHDSLQGRKIKGDPILSTGKKILLAVGWLFAVGLVTVAVLASHGTLGSLHLPSWAVTALKAGAGIYTSSLGLFSIGILGWVCVQRKERNEANLRLLVEEDYFEPELHDSERRSRSSRYQEDSLLMEEEEDPLTWGSDSGISPLKSKKKEVKPVSIDKLIEEVKGCGSYYDFVDHLDQGEKGLQSGLPKRTGFGHFALPNIGLYSAEAKKSSFEPLCHHMAVKLPKQQLKNFPKPLQEFAERRRDAECHFIVFKSPEEAKKYVNLSMHGMACSDYSRSYPRVDRAVPMGLWPIDGVDKRQASPKDRTCIPTFKETLEGTSVGLQNVPHIVHNDSKGSPVVSYSRRAGQYGRIYIEKGKDVTSCYIATEVNGKAVMTHAVILNDSEGTKGGSDLMQACEEGGKSVYDFLNSLFHSGSKDTEWAQAIFHTFSQPK